MSTDTTTSSQPRNANIVLQIREIPLNRIYEQLNAPVLAQNARDTERTSREQTQTIAMNAAEIIGLTMQAMEQKRLAQYFAGQEGTDKHASIKKYIRNLSGCNYADHDAVKAALDGINTAWSMMQS